MASPASESNPSNIELPAPEASDSAEVTSCLEAAGELWKSGQHREAIRFVQRGAEAAEQDGNDRRALQLARLGADLSAELAASAAPAAPAAASTGNGAAASSSAAAVSAPAAPSPPHPANPSSVSVSQPPPLPGGSAVSAPTASPPSVGPAPSAKAKDKDEAKAKDKDESKTKPKDGAKAKDEGDDRDAAPVAAPPPNGSSTGAPPSVRGAPAARASRAPLPAAERASVKPSASRSGPVASAPPKPSTPPTPAAATSSSVAELIASGLAERVSVKRSSLDPGLLVVRPMSGGAKPAHGARQAVLIYVEGDAEA